jgi:uncharacterized protein
MHHRLGPKQNRFHYDVFMFYLDLDEIDELAARSKWMSRNRRNLFNFRDKDHMQFPAEAPDGSKRVREQLSDYLATQGISLGKGRVQLLTNLCTMGYQFNPASFYFCHHEDGSPLCAVAEVGNTFREMKVYLLGRGTMSENGFRSKMRKFFYVSPFIDMDAWFDFDLVIPGEKLQVRIDDYDGEGNRFLISTLSGKRVALTDRNLLAYFFRFPFITLKVIGLIHWQALKLWLKRVPHFRKADRKDLQREVLRPYESP